MPENNSQGITTLNLCPISPRHRLLRSLYCFTKISDGYLGAGIANLIFNHQISDRIRAHRSYTRINQQGITISDDDVPSF